MDDKVGLLFLHNSSESDIPPFCPMELVGLETTGNPILEVQLPSEDSLNQIVVNGPATIHAGDYEAIPNSWPRWATYSSTEPAVGDDMGAASGTSGMQVDLTGFTCLAVDDGKVLVRPSGGGGGAAAFSIVQAYADGANGTVSTKAMSLKADPTASPNYDLSAGTTILNYFKA